VARLLSRNGVGVLTSFISPYASLRKHVRGQVENFIEVHCDCPVEVCEARDTKGLYAKARKGEIAQFTGISDPYERPENPEIHLRTDTEGVEECAQRVVSYLVEKKLI
jgi:adenylylsulfate kinase-like enzyme